MKIIFREIFQPPVTSSLLDQNNFPHTPFSYTFNLCSSFTTEDQVPHPYTTSVVIIIQSLQGHPNTMLFADKKKLIQKN